MPNFQHSTGSPEERRHLVGVGTFSASPLAKQLVNEVLDSNRLSYGPMTQRFEADFARLHGCRFGIMSNSGTSALQLALQAMKEIHGWQDGDEVLVPAVTFVATANIVLHNRMIPVLVDVDPLYYGLDPALMEKAITPRTRAVIPVHLFGQAADMDPILEVARKHSLKVIEDTCETMFANYKGRRVGSLGDVGCFSTYVAHLIVTGVGGINTTNNPDYMIKIRSLLNHGRDSIYISIDDAKDKQGEELHTIIERRFSFVSVGHSFRVTEMESALGLAQLADWETMIAKRRRNAALLTEALKPFDNVLQTPAIRPDCEHSFMMYPLVLRQEGKRELVNFLEDNGVETRDMLPLTQSAGVPASNPPGPKRISPSPATLIPADFMSAATRISGPRSWNILSTASAGISAASRPKSRTVSPWHCSPTGAARRSAPKSSAFPTGIVRAHFGVGQWHARFLPRRAGSTGRCGDRGRRARSAGHRP